MTVFQIFTLLSVERTANNSSEGSKAQLRIDEEFIEEEEEKKQKKEARSLTLLFFKDHWFEISQKFSEQASFCCCALMENTKASTIPEEILDSVSEESKIWAEGHGIVMYTKHDLRLTHAPFTLLPSPVPQKQFQQAINLAVPFNYLVEKISSHPTFLFEQLKRYQLSSQLC